MENKKLPKEEGFYWVKTDRMKYYNGIVLVCGDSPFYKLYGYDFSREEEIKSIDEIDEFGNKIIEME